MKKQISKDTLENYLMAVESAVRDSFPLNSSVVSNLNEIKRLALRGYDFELAGQGALESQSNIEKSAIAQLGIR